MNRVILGAIAGAVFAAICYGFGLLAFPGDPTVARGALVGAFGGALVACASGGAQVALVARQPQSNASFTAFGVGFFAKLLILGAGILTFGTRDLGCHPAGFGVAFVAASILVSGFTLSALLSNKNE